MDKTLMVVQGLWCLPSAQYVVERFIFRSDPVKTSEIVMTEMADIGRQGCDALDLAYEWRKD